MCEHMRKGLFALTVTLMISLLMPLESFAMGGGDKLQLLGRVRGKCEARTMNVFGAGVKKSHGKNKDDIVHTWVGLSTTASQGIWVSPEKPVEFMCNRQKQELNCPKTTSYVEIVRHGYGSFFASCYRVAPVRKRPSVLKKPSLETETNSIRKPPVAEEKKSFSSSPY